MGEGASLASTASLFSFSTFSYRSELDTPSPASALDSFMAGSVENESTLRENESALTVVEHFDLYWFWDNVLSYAVRPRSGSPSSETCSYNPQPSPFRSIEMVTPMAADRKGCRRPSDDAVVDLPKPLLERTRSELEESDRETMVMAVKVQEKKSSRHRRLLNEMPVDLAGGPASGSRFDLSTHRKRSRSVEHGVDQLNCGVDFADYKTAPSSTKGTEHPSTVSRFSKLETIPADRQLQEPTVPDDRQLQEPTVPDVGIQRTTMRRRERRRATKSMTDLEFDEVKGFMDLGFKFDMDDLNPHVVSVLPGLQRLGGPGKTEKHAQTPPMVSRPYLSEAWLIRRSDSPLLNWGMPSLHEEGVDVKKQLKFWARAVASTVQ